MIRERGFTLIEAMVAMVILLLLGALAYPSYAGYVVKTRRIEAQVAMIETLQQEERHYAQHNSYVAFSSEAPPDQLRVKWWSGASPATSAYELDARACPDQPLSECVEVRARPGTPKVDARFQDAECGTLSIDSSGGHGATGPSERCWP